MLGALPSQAVGPPACGGQRGSLCLRCDDAACDATRMVDVGLADLVDLAAMCPFGDFVRLGDQRIARQRILVEPSGFEPLTFACKGESCCMSRQ